MKNILLGIIAINLTFISANLYLRSVEPVQAQVSEYEIRGAIKTALTDCNIRPLTLTPPAVYIFRCK